MSLFSPIISNLLTSPFTRKFLTEISLMSLLNRAGGRKYSPHIIRLLTIHSYRQVYDRKPAPYIRTGRLLTEGTEENKIVTRSKL